MLVVVFVCPHNIQHYILTMLTRYTQALLFLILYSHLHCTSQALSLFVQSNTVVASFDLDHMTYYSLPTHSTLIRMALADEVHILLSLDL